MERCLLERVTEGGRGVGGKLRSRLSFEVSSFDRGRGVLFRCGIFPKAVGGSVGRCGGRVSAGRRVVRFVM